VDLDGNVIHVKSLDKPVTPKKDPLPPPASTSKPANVGDDDDMEGVEGSSEKKESQGEVSAPEVDEPTVPAEGSSDKGESKPQPDTVKDPWPENFTTTLAAFLSEEAISKVKTMYLEGPEPPRVSDSGWGGRPPKPVGEGETDNSSVFPEPVQEEPEKAETGKRGRDRGGRGGRGARGGRVGRGGRGGVAEKTTGRCCRMSVSFYIYTFVLNYVF
jgi:tRNA pseudouridine13 synthase